MKPVIVVNNPKDWSFDIPGVEVLSARSYLTEPRLSAHRATRVFNLCRSYRYQSLGYYVSLLAAARGHKPVPTVATMQDLKATEIARIRSEELDVLIQQSLKPITSSEFQLSIYFGRNMARRYDRLSAKLFQLFYAPLLRATFTRGKDNRWFLKNISAIASGAIPDNHDDFVLSVATEYFKAKRWTAPRHRPSRYDLAILVDPGERDPPSNSRALDRFARAARKFGIATTTIEKDEYSRLAEFDALFIRTTTNVHHFTYRFARRASTEGMVVIDDPESILLCTNKVYLKELMDRHHIPAPKTLVVHRDNVSSVLPALGLPCVLKKPDSAFSLGVVKVETEAEFQKRCEELLTHSELIIAQQFMPTEFDWRVGVLDHKPLWCSKYYMAPNHWQIMNHANTGHARYGKAQTLSVAEAPPRVVSMALRVARLIGDGLYGVDLKVVGSRVYVVEVNDNPSIDAGCEDAVLKDSLYQSIMEAFLRRLERGQRGTRDR